ncbi:MAG: FkbM family methyltransferase [Gemmatimonadota bacterium]
MRRLKHALKWLLTPLSVRIRGGPLAGYRWSAATGSRFVTGTYEPSKTRAYLDHLRPGETVVDVGAHVGYYAILAAKLVGPEGRVVAFEPRPLNLRFLRLHLRLNGVANVELHEAGVAASSGRSAFDTRTGTGTGRLAADGDLDVRTISLDELYQGGELVRVDFLKIDVEGGEMEVLRGAHTLIRETMPSILVATHGDDLHRAVTELLDELGYSQRVLDAQGRSGDTEILAIPPSRL